MTTKEKLVLAQKLADVPAEDRGEVLEIAKALAGGTLVPKRNYKARADKPAKKPAAKKKATKKAPAAPPAEDAA